MRDCAQSVGAVWCWMISIIGGIHGHYKQGIKCCMFVLIYASLFSAYSLYCYYLCLVCDNRIYDAIFACKDKFRRIFRFHSCVVFFFKVFEETTWGKPSGRLPSPCTLEFPETDAVSADHVTLTTPQQGHCIGGEAMQAPTAGRCSSTLGACHPVSSDTERLGINI